MGAPWRFLPCSNCCEGECNRFEDDFDRESSSNIGSDWTEEAGDWSIESDDFLTTADTNAIAIASWNVHVNHLAHRVQVKVDGSTDDVLRIIGGWADSSNYWYGQAALAAGGIEFSLWKVSGGSATQETATITDTGEGAFSAPLDLHLCLYSAGVEFMYREAGGNEWRTGGNAVGGVFLGKQGGVGTGGTAAGIEFDEFEISEHRSSHILCPPCPPPTTHLRCPLCISNQTPVTFRAVFSGITEDGCGDCSELNSTWDLPFYNATTIVCRWGYDPTTLEWEFCNIGAIHAEIWVAGGGGFDVKVHYKCAGTGTPDCIEYEKHYDTEPDCLSFNSENIPWVSTDARVDCNASASTCSLTAV
jgi:hypothetical protein